MPAVGSPSAWMLTRKRSITPPRSPRPRSISSFVFDARPAPARLTNYNLMDINITTPAVLFPAVSLLLLAYTNRFLALASVIRKLHADYKASPSPHFLSQIQNLRRRIRLVRNMQFFGVLSLLF